MASDNLFKEKYTMISENELAAAVVTVEQCIRDGEEDKHKYKQDSARLKELSLQLLIDKTKLQVLHYAQGILQMLSEQEIQAQRHALDKKLAGMQEAVETNLFSPSSDETKEQERAKCVFRTKMFALSFVLGEEKKVF